LTTRGDTIESNMETDLEEATPVEEKEQVRVQYLKASRCFYNTPHKVKVSVACIII
jgi:hypothetical protein